MRQKKLIIITAVLLALTIGLTGCGKKAAEKAAEKATENAIEKATNGQADVDISGNTVSVNTDQGSYQAGGNVDLPAGFPDDVYVADGNITAAFSTTETNGYTVSIESSQSVSELKALYEQKLQSEGWNISLNMTFEGSASLSAEKDQRIVSIGMNPDDSGKTVVVISTYQQN